MRPIRSPQKKTRQRHPPAHAPTAPEIAISVATKAIHRAIVVRDCEDSTLAKLRAIAADSKDAEASRGPQRDTASFRRG
jgi:hypothetical protein